MKQKLITTEKATILALMLPEGASNIFINNIGVLRYSHMQGKWSKCIELPPGNCQPLGFANEVSEEVAKEIMPYEETFDNFNRFISGYRNGSVLYRIALPAFHSLLKDNEVELTDNVYILKMI